MLTALLPLLAATTVAANPPNDDARTVAEMDRAYQLAVKQNDIAKMGQILHPDFQLVLGSGRKINRDELLARSGKDHLIWEVQDEEAGSQAVRVTADTAIVTAKLLLKGKIDGQAFDMALWFSDTYIRTESGWRYLFGQASLPLPPAQ